MRARELTTDEAARPLGWRYEGAYATYDVNGPLGTSADFFAVEGANGELVGFGCTGAEARVSGVEARQGTVDVGYGMRPDLTGQGRGHEFVGVVLGHVVERHPEARLRMCILQWNGRSRRVAEGHGFRITGRAGAFDVLVREAAAKSL